MTKEQRELLEGATRSSLNEHTKDAIRAALRELDAAERVVDEARDMVRCDAVTGLTTDPESVKRHFVGHAAHVSEALDAYDAARKGE